MTTALLLAGAGFLLLLTEMFLPGGVLGVLGGLALLASVIFGYIELGLVGGTILLGAITAIVLVGFCAWMAFFPRTAVGRQLTLDSTLSSGAELSDVGVPVGAEGLALTPLRPVGKAQFGDRRVDVVAESAFIAHGNAIVVSAAEGARIVVRKKG